MNEDENNNLQDEVLKDEIKEKKQEREEQKAEQSDNVVVSEVKSQIKSKAKKEFFKTKIGKSVSKFFGKISEALTNALGPIIAAVLIIFIAIGVIGYLLNAPSFIIGNIKQMITNAVDGVDKLLWGSDGQFDVDNFDKEKRLKVLNYISKDLGLDVIGFGFVPVATYKSDDGNGGASQEIEDYDAVINSVNNVNKESVDQDLIYFYLVANERAFVINKDGVLGKIFKNHSDWTGMLYLDDDVNFDGIEATVDRENETLNVSCNNINFGELLNEDNYSFPLDGWTGRFGNPLEFSLALHISTMSSGMVKELITNPNLQTEVHIGFREVKCIPSFKINIKDSDGNIKEANLKNDPDGDEEALYDKIVEGKEITDQDLSIQGLLYASRKAKNQYEIDLGKGATFSGIQKHLKTIDALLNDDKLAVDISTDYIYIDDTSGSELQYEFLYSNTFPAYAVKDDPINKGVDINDAWEDYTISSGAYICSYKDGKPDENTGKLSEKWVPVDTSIDEEYVFEKIGETDTSYKYQLKVHQFDGNENKFVDVSDKKSPKFITYIPKLNQTSVMAKDDIGRDMVSVQIKGLSSLTRLDNLSTEEKKAYAAVLKEIDWFIAYNICCNGWDAGLLNYKSKDSNGNSVSADQIKQDIENFKNVEMKVGEQTKYDFNLISYYTRLFEEACQNPEKFDAFYTELQKDYNTIINNPKFVKNNQEVYNKVQEVLQAKGITEENIEEIAGILQYDSNNDLDASDLNYVQPYIKKVIKHWYKDIDFTNAYAETKEPIIIPYTGTSNPNIEIQVQLTPKSGKLYEQTGQPYVIKGDVVLCDGKYVETDEYTKKTDGYNWGDGYRTTKKILTEGFYYSYNGSRDTTRSIYFQQEIEDREYGENATGLLVYVRNGGIYEYRVLSEYPNLPVPKLNMTFGEALNENNVIGAGATLTSDPNNDAIKVYYIADSYIGEGTSESVETLQKSYIVYIKNPDGKKEKILEYFSPVDYSPDEVDKRVKKINSLWEAMGVQSLRQHLSFDNVTSEGQIMATTGLSILKNCDTKDAEYIYRDLKEMLIELGYYTQAEFDALETNVLKWFIPSYSTDKWPQNSIDDLDNFTAAVLYPYDETAEKEENEATEGSDGTNDTETITSENMNSELGIAFDRSKGFKENLDVIAPGDCIILSAENGILEIEFESRYQPEIAVIDGYTMLIEGVKLNEEITTKDSNDAEIIVSVKNAIANKSIIKAGSVIGKTGTDEIKVVLQNDIGRVLSNVNDYMSPDIGKPWDGKFSEEFLTYLAKLEGMPITTDDYFTEENNGVNWLKNEKAITVGPGLYLIDGNNKKLFEEKGYDTSNFGNRTEWENNPGQFKFLKSDTVDVYIAALEGFKNAVEKQGLSNLTQNQFEALVILVYNTGPGGNTFKDVVDTIKNGGDLQEAWIRYAGDSHYNRRMAEYRLYTEGIYTVENLQMEFLSDTPFEDMIEGTTSFKWVNLK